MTITANDVIGQGPTNGAAENSIQIGFGATGTVTSNTVGSDVWAPDVFGDTGDAAAGILVYASPTVAIKSINGSDEAAIHVDDTCTGASTGNMVTKNQINSACAGILSGPGASGNTTIPNTFYNVVTLQSTGTNTCTPPPGIPNRAAARSHARIRAARP